MLRYCKRGKCEIYVHFGTFLTFKPCLENSQALLETLKLWRVYMSLWTRSHMARKGLV